MNVQILDFIKKEHPSYSTIIDHFGNESGNFLNTLVEEGLVDKVKGNYYLVEELNLIPGTVVSIKRNITFINIDEDKDVAVDNKDIKNALLGDKVLLKKTSYYRDEVYEVVKITKRENEYVSGMCYGFGDEYCLNSDREISPNVPFIIHNVEPFKPGQIIRCKIVKYNQKSIIVEPISLIGNPLDIGMDITRIIASNNAPIEFPQSVIDEVKLIPSFVEEKEKEGRENFVDHIIVTIDGEDAKDFDDAVEVALVDDIYYIGVHIADVAHYVKEDSPLDKEALNRSTSLYVQDRVVPMLPFELSNGICSLNPNVERLVTSCLFAMDKQGNILTKHITKGVIKSHARLTYTYVNSLIEKFPSLKELSPLEEMLKNLYEASRIIRAKRNKNGSIELNTTELKFEFDAKLNPVGIRKKSHGLAEDMIEDLMISANEIVASTIEEMKLPMIYRVHNNPKAKKLESFMRISASKNYPCNFDILKCSPKDVSKYLTSIKDEKDKEVLSSLLLRCLAKAKYSPKNEKHFGLASSSYTHFTSPIRRYPDLLVHRLIDRYIVNNNISEDAELSIKIAKIAMLTSTRERRGLTIERTVDSHLCAKYMKRYVGCEYKARIVSMVTAGMFVELDNGVEGMVPFESISGDYYIFDEEIYCAYGIRKHRHFNLGDIINVMLLSSDEEKNKITFAYLDTMKINRKKNYGRKFKSSSKK